MNLLILGFGYSASAFALEARALFSTITVTARSPEKVARLRAEGGARCPSMARL